MKKIKLAYFGSPDFAANFLEKILTDKDLFRLIEVRLVVTQPDKKVGRKQILTPTPVKKVAEKYQKSENTFFEIIARGPLGGVAVEKNGIELTNIDLALVYAYSDLIPNELFTLPKYGFWNIHPSLLPKYRGPSPMATALINGDKKTGITIIKMDEEIDHGPIIAQESLTIKDNDKRPYLEKKLTNLAYKMFKEIMGKIPTGDKKFRSEPFIAQNHKLATYTKKLSKQDGFIEFKKIKNALIPSPYSLTVYNLFRGLYPWPGLWTLLPNGRRLKITGLNIVRNKNLCSLQIKRVQLEGKKEVDFETFNKAYKIF
ncbi:MAG: methionyl-tRNA formyltransferase [Patescibacteria group bacterium]